MNISYLLRLANESGGTLYLMLALLLVALTVIIERAWYLSNMQQRGERLIAMLKKSGAKIAVFPVAEELFNLPHARLFDILQHEPAGADRTAFEGHLEEAIMHEVPALDRSLWMLDTVITLAPLLGLFGTIIGMFNAFHVLGDVQNNASQVTGGIAEALIATASGLFIAMLGLVFFNMLHTRVRLIVHQLETIKVMLVNRHDRSVAPVVAGRTQVELIHAPRALDMRYLETRKARIEIIPMIDIMLFLLVFFAMLTLRMIPTSGHVTKLPTSSTAVAIPPPKLLVEIREDGALVVENHVLTAPQLTDLLRQRGSSKTAVTIAGNQTASLQQVMRVIDAIRNGGATEIGLATRNAPGK